MIKIVTDSTCYLPSELVAEHDIQIVPVLMIMEDHVYREGLDMDIAQLFEKVAQTSSLPTTSQPNIDEFEQTWRPLVEAGHHVLTILLSSRLSSTFAAAQAAAQQFVAHEHLQVVDSLSVAMGLGMQVLRAAEMARQGFPGEAIVSALAKMRKAIQIIFTIDTLEYLHRGGRINGAQAWLGTLLRVKPLLQLREGAVEPLEQVRTARRALERLLERTRAYLEGDRSPWIAVMHSRSPDMARELLETLRAHFPGARFFCSEIGPVLGTHLGPRGAGIIACPSSAL